MRKFIIIFLLTCLPVFSTTLNGSINYNADKKQTVAKFSDGSYAIIYDNDPLHSWYYDKNGTLINKEEKTSANYPYISKKYTPDGKLVNTTYRISNQETYIYNKKGETIAHWLGPNCYDTNGNIIMTREFIK